MDTRPDPNSVSARADSERVVYVVPSDGVLSLGNDGMDLAEVWDALLQGKWLIIIITSIFVALAVAYALLAKEWYRAEVLLTPAETKATRGLGDQLGGLGGLASLAGISIGETDSVEPLAVLQSRGFIRAFITDRKLLPVLFADEWDASSGRWKSADAKDQPDIHDAIKYFDEKILRVEEDKKSNLVTLTVEWTDPEVAAEWANDLVRRLNSRMRQRALQEADSNVNFLKQELAASTIVALQQSGGRLLESELQKAMLARVNEEFAFRVIDRADAPKWRSRPKRTQLVALAAAVGILLSSIAVLMRHAVRRSRVRAGEVADSVTPAPHRVVP